MPDEIRRWPGLGLATGLYYYRARYYDPETGRFVSPDPIGWAAGQTNGYAYVGGDPIGYVDPDGLAPGDRDFGIKNAGFWKWWETNKLWYGPFDKSHNGFNPDQSYDLPNREMANRMVDEYEACKTRDSGRGGKIRGGNRSGLRGMRGGWEE